MAILSVLSKNVGRILAGSLTKPAVNGIKSVNSIDLLCKDGIRNMSGGHGDKRLFMVTASRFQWKLFKNLVHFYAMLGIIPLGILTLYCNTFIGPAELHEIPEGYVPDEWEYFQNPIKRWFARYIYTTDQEYYERALHYVTIKEEQRRMRLLTGRVKRAMQKNEDYKAWYYKPVTGKYHRIQRENWDIAENEHSSLPKRTAV